MVTIIVPVYNAEKYIKRCLDSVCGQSYKDLEIVLVNDGSTDNSLNILQEYTELDHRIKVINQENRGVAVARNTGLRNATGDFILYVDSDDWIEKNMVQRMMELMEDADIVFCSSDHADSPEKVEKEDSLNIEIWDQEKQQLEFMKHKRMTGMLWNKLIRRTLTTGISFNEKTGYGEDAEFLWKVLKQSKKMVVTNEILYHHVLEETKRKVSVIVPIYNTEKYLRKCLESIQNQSYQNLEVILIDDGSKDNSENIAKEFELCDVRFSLVSKENAGVSAARNLGLEIATGDYILFVDSDDWLEKNMISTLVENIEETTADIACCQYDRTSSTDIAELEIWSQEKSLKEFIIHKQINGSIVNKLFRKKVVEGIRLEPSIKYGEDALFLWNILLNIKSLAITNKVLYHVTLHEDSASGGGSYKPIRRDCIKVWNRIVDNATEIGKEYEFMARAQLANMAFFSLYEMVYYGYKEEDQQLLFIRTLKKNISYLKKARFIPKSEKILAGVILWNIDIGKIIIVLRKRIKA